MQEIQGKRRKSATRIKMLTNYYCESDMDGEMDEDGDGIYDFAPLPPFDLQRESEETRRTGALHLLRMNANDGHKNNFRHQINSFRISSQSAIFELFMRVEVTPLR